MKIKFKNSFQSVTSRYGSYSLGAIALVIAIVIVANLIVGQLPETLRNVDLSDSKIYDISEISRELLKDLEHPVTITVLAEKDNVDQRIRNFTERYAAISSKITLEWVDPVLHPAALKEYDAQADTMVVACEETDRQRLVSFEDIITYDQMSYYTTGSMQETAFDGEGQLTAAVNYVTSSEGRQVYYSAGHGESAFSSSVQDLMEKANYTMTEWNLLMNPEIPEDCELFLMNGAVSDVTEDEQQGILDYLQKGGRVMVLLPAEAGEDTPNLNAVFKEYGMERAKGYIADMERSYQQNPFYIFPELSLGEELSNGMSSEMVMMINSQGFEQVDPKRDTITVTPFMNTSASGVLVDENGKGKEQQGTYIIGAVAEETISSNNASADSAEDGKNSGDEAEESGDELESRLTVLGTNTMIDENVTSTFTTLENLTLFMNAVGANFGEDAPISIEPKSLEVAYNTVQYPGMFSLLVVLGIPVVVLGAGFFTWMRRRKA